MKTRSGLVHHLRDHIVGGLHTGQLSTGDRLPGIREVAAELGVNDRTVAAAYRVLESERLVEIRQRSGVFVARQQLLTGETPAEMVSWLSEVLTAAWKRRIPTQKLAGLLHRATGSRRIKCGLVDAVEDGVVAFRHELEHAFGLEVTAMSTHSLAEDVDFYATTSFYAPDVHDAVARSGKPLVLLTINPAIRAAIKRQLSKGVLTVIAVDSGFAERLRVAYELEASRIRLVLAKDRAGVRALPQDEPVLLTRAAEDFLGTIPQPLLFPHSPTLSSETASDIARLLVRMNFDAKPLMVY